MGNREQLRLQLHHHATAVHAFIVGERSTHVVSIEPDKTWAIAARATGPDGRVIYEATKMLVTSIQDKGPTKGKIIATNNPRRKPGEMYKLSSLFWNFLGEEADDPTKIALKNAGVRVKETFDTSGEKPIRIMKTTFPWKTVGEVPDWRKRHNADRDTTFTRLRVV
jgi:hypothetical protein